MNEIFSLQRFGALLARYWAEKKIITLLLWLVTLVLMGWFFDDAHNSWLRSGHSPWQLEKPVFIVGLLFFMLLQVAVSFTELMKRKTTANFMMIPASRMEKFLFVGVNHIAVPMLFYCVAALALDWLIYKSMYPQSGMLLIREHSGMFDFSRRWGEMSMVVFSVLYVFIGCFTFRKNHLLYSVLTLALVFYVGLSMMESYLIKNYISKDLYNAGAFGDVGYLHNNFGSQVDGGILRDFQPGAFAVTGLYFAGMIYVAYLKFREMQAKV